MSFENFAFQPFIYQALAEKKLYKPQRKSKVN